MVFFKNIIFNIQYESQLKFDEIIQLKPVVQTTKEMIILFAIIILSSQDPITK